MKYFFINNSLNPKVLGHYPQVKSIKQNCDLWDEPKFIEHIEFVKVNFQAITANAVLHPKSKQTDLINVSGMGFTRKLLMSGELKKILENNRKSGLQFFKSNLIKDIEIDDYWVLNMYEINQDYIDFTQANIYLTEYTVNKIRKLNIQNYQEFRGVKDEINLQGYPAGIMIEEFMLIDNIHQDFFAVSDVMGGVKYIVSEKLKKEIEDAGCTGIEFQPVELSYQEWTAPGGKREKVYGKL